MTDTGRSAWFVLRASTRQMKVARALQAKGFEVFLPMQQRHRQWSDRVKVSATPMFSSLVFCRFDPKDRVLVLSTPGVARERERNGIPLEISDAEIERLRRISELPYPAEECDPLPNPRDSVRITRDPEIRGFLSERGSPCHVVIPCPSIGRAVVMLVPEDVLERDDNS